MAVIPVEILILAVGYVIMLLGISLEIRMLKYMGAIFIMVLGVMFLYPGVAGISNSSLIAITIGTISICLGFYYLIEDSFSHFTQADRPDVYHENDGRYYSND